MPLGPILYGDPVEWGHPLNRGLVSWWLPLPGRGAGPVLWDLAGRNHGTLTSGPTWGAGPGGFGAVQFDGSDDYVSLATVSGLGDATVAALFRPTSAATPYDRVVDAGYINGFWLGRDGTTSTYGGAFVSADVPPYGAFAAITENAWNLVTVTRVGSANTAYANGVAGTTFTQSAAATSSTALAFGENRTTNVGSDNFTGQIGAVWLWGRALSATEVGQLYDQSQRGHPDTLRRASTRRYGFLPPVPPTAAVGWLVA